MTEAIAAALGAILGTLGAVYVATRTARRTEQASATTAAIYEYFSDEFLKHRVSLSVTRKKYRRGDVTIAEIAAGFWFPGAGAGYYDGDTHDNFTEHQHIEAYLGYISRLDFLLRRRWTSAADLERALSSKLLWNDAFLRALADETVRQAREAGAPRPQWVDSVRNVSREVLNDAARAPC